MLYTSLQTAPGFRKRLMLDGVTIFDLMFLGQSGSVVIVRSSVVVGCQL